MERSFYLLIDSSITLCYFASKWIEHLGQEPGFRGILVTEERPPDTVLKQRRSFHAENHEGANDSDLVARLSELYRPLDKAEEAMVRRFGAPRHSVSHYPDTQFLGKDINAETPRKWITEACSRRSPLIFSRIGCIFAPWWIEITNHQLFNCHSAVLPYARGVFALENIAARGIPEELERAAGATVHYVDSNVDTGPIIRADRIIDPFHLDSIWDLKGYCHWVASDMYTQVARQILDHPDRVPAGVAADPKCRGVNYRRVDFTAARRLEAERAYMSMKQISRGCD